MSNDPIVTAYTRKQLMQRINDYLEDQDLGTLAELATRIFGLDVENKNSKFITVE